MVNKKMKLKQSCLGYEMIFDPILTGMEGIGRIFNEVSVDFKRILDARIPAHWSTTTSLEWNHYSNVTNYCVCFFGFFRYFRTGIQQRLSLFLLLPSLVNRKKKSEGTN